MKDIVNKKEKLIEGYIAFASDGKMLRNYYTGGQCGSNKQSLTDDIELVSIEPSTKTLEIYSKWYNNSHKNKQDFTVKKVLLIRTVELKIEG